MVRAPGVPKAPRTPKAAAPPKPKAPAAPAVAPETAPTAPAETVAPVVAPNPVVAPKVTAPVEPVPVPAYFMVSENITPATKRHPGAQMQYAAKRFYVADEFLTELWRNGDPCIQPYEPKPGE